MAPAILIFVGLIVGIPLVIALIVLIIAPIFRALGWFIGRIFKFIGAEITDVFRLIGATLTAIFYVPMSVFNVVLGRWSAAQHYGRALTGECGAWLACVYRMAIGHPLRLFGAESVVEGFEKRVPQVVAAAPPGTAAGLRRGAAEAGGGVSSARSGQFAGYAVIGTLPGGGSGGKLYIARPDAAKLSAFQRQGLGPVGDVVIKSFSMGEGSLLPQIVRENRALEAARRLGLVLEHELSNERFFYVMRYVPGDSLGVLTPRLHAMGGGSGLPARELSSAIGYACDLLGTLHEYHRAGLWHKDVKPDNIIVANGHAHLVDFGLVTPLRSSMTLTTHGTEYFRDPEMVRLALRGVKVHEVDGAKFDIYAAGAVLFSMIENSFPAHGGLSQITRSCPEALRWIVRRAMTDYDKRYASVQAMLADLSVVHQAAQRGDATSVRPADLPSVKAGEGAESLAGLGAGPDGALPHAPPPPPVGRWRGAAPVAHQANEPAGFDFGVGARHSPRTPGRSAADQLASARARVAAMRRRAAGRMNRTARAPQKSNFGVAVASLVVVMAVAGGLGALFLRAQQGEFVPVAEAIADEAEVQVERGRVRVASAEQDVFGVPDAPEPPDEPRAPLADRARVVESSSGVSVTRSGTPARASSQTGKGITVLFMQESAGFDERGQGEIAAVMRRLTERGFETVSRDALPEDPDEARLASARYVELAGSLRAAVGLRVLGGAEASESVRDWLEAHDEVHAVVWITPDRSSESPRVRKLVFTGASAPKTATRAVQDAVTGRRR
ncbi:MAG: serine/threonine protein kinase [Phycisphaerales bacterium]